MLNKEEGNQVSGIFSNQLLFSSAQDEQLRNAQNKLLFGAEAPVGKHLSMNNSMIASSFASTSVHGHQLFSRGDTQSTVMMQNHHQGNPNLIFSPSSLNGNNNMSELRMMFGGNGLPATRED